AVARPDVALWTGSWSRYTLWDRAPWSLLAPRAGAVFLPSASDAEPHTVAMMHQLWCVDELRAQLAVPRAERTAQPTDHCLNYLRQSILCRGDMHLEGWQYPDIFTNFQRDSVRRCRDWRGVYEWVEANQLEYAGWL
ncbi:uncharacterized protein BXZ73DRAFT_24978, partial [Epithele typhae]|uniref:uncharacterized protein n=1 Tax=Epithele typhae TaxID=378194 RepID=UPI002007B1D5